MELLNKFNIFGGSVEAQEEEDITDDIIVPLDPSI